MGDDVNLLLGKKHASNFSREEETDGMLFTIKAPDV